MPARVADVFEIDFDAPRELSGVSFDSPSSQEPMRFALETLEQGGAWRELAAAQSESRLPPAPDLRARATEALRQAGIGYIVVDPVVYGFADFEEHAAEWRLRKLGTAANGVRLYQLLP